MNFQNLKYFIAIAEEKNISAAARNLYVSQQSLSEHLKKLEREVGVPLFQRNSSKGASLTLTVAGECFLDGCKNILSEYDRMMANINAVTEQRRSKITIAVATYGDPPFLSGLLMSYAQNYPQYEVSVIKRLHRDVAQNMLGADLYISYLPVDETLEVVPILDDDPFCALFQKSLAESVYQEEWPQIYQKLIDTQDLAVIRRIPFILLNDRHGQLSNDLDIIFKENGITPVTGFLSENGDLNFQMCLKGVGCLLAPQDYIRRKLSFQSDHYTKDLLCIPFRQTGFQSKLAICYEKGKHLHAAEICFLNEAKAYFQREPAL